MKKRIIFFVWVSIFMFGLLSSINIPQVDASEMVVNASTVINRGGINSHTIKGFDGSCTLYVDKSISIGRIYIDGDLKLTGSNQLTVTSIEVTGNLIIDSNTNITISEYHIHAGKNITIKKGANLQFTSFSGKYPYNCALHAEESIINAGNISIKSNDCGIHAGRDINITEGKINITCDHEAIYADNNVNISEGEFELKIYSYIGIGGGYVSISGGVISAQSFEHAIYALKDIKITGGKMNVSAEYQALFTPMQQGAIEVTGGSIKVNCTGSDSLTSYSIIVNGGSIESTCSLKNVLSNGIKIEQVNNFKAYNSINIGENMVVKSPEGGTVSARKEGTKNINYYAILGPDGGVPEKIAIIKDATASNNNHSKYNNEWVNGKWYDSDGNQTYAGILQWKSNATGWWVEDTSGWYPADQWQKIDGIWYYFKPDGYMASNEYYKGYWFNADGSWDDKYLLSWKSNSTGWWVEDKSGWWPSNSWIKIDGYWYYFDASGYMVTSQYIDGWWISADGVCY